MPRLNIPSTVRDIANKIETTQQAELGKTESGHQISFYVNRALMDVAEALGIKKQLKKELDKRGITL